MAKRLIPLLDRILVEKLSPPAKSIGGVLLPDTAGKVTTHLICDAHSAEQHDLMSDRNTKNTNEVGSLGA